MNLIEALPPEGTVAILCKTMTARKVLRHFWKTEEGREGSLLFRFDAKAAFGVAVDACLFMTTGKTTTDRTATVYSDLDLASDSTRFGFIDGDLVSDIRTYRRHKYLDGGSLAYRWRSGVKHDAAKVMEFARDGEMLRNGLGETVRLEDDFVFPLLKSSDLGNGRFEASKFVLVTQTHTSADTSHIASAAPNTWEYLLRHADVLDGRRSSIYRNRPRFAVFGIGPYSFSPWKIAISGLYKSFRFVIVPPAQGRPVMVDDTCYSIPCQCEEEAVLLHELLSSDSALAFLRSLAFMDSKRPLTVDILQRVSLAELARRSGKTAEFEGYARAPHADENVERQMMLIP